jgi:D-alanyl-D-alanine carboxypeptidase/D-alanyl-D-alanine-endopeptidase (penicillin-binding protein 4)
VPQSGDGDLWPTTDDDTPSQAPKDTETHELPVPDQQKQADDESQAEAADTDAAEDAEPAAAGQDGDEPHAKPEQQVTRPMSWPVADLERQAASPAWPSVESGTEKNQQDIATSFTKPERPELTGQEDAKTAFVHPVQPPGDTEPETQASEDEPEDSRPGDAAAEPGATPEPEPPTSEDTTEPASHEESGPADAEDQDESPSGESADTTPDEVESAPAQESGAPERDVPSSRESSDRTRPHARPAAQWPSEPRQEDAPTSFMRPVQPKRDEPRPNFRRPQETRQESAPTSFLRPDSRPTGSRPPNFVRPATPREEATSFIPRDAGGAPVFSRPENPTTFLRRDNPATPPDRKSEWPPPEPPRAAPARVGPEPEPAEPEPAKKSRKPLLIAAISVVAVIAVAAGVVFGVPGLSDKLGLTGEDPVAIDPPPAPISYSPALHGPDAAAPAPTQQGIEQALAGPMSDPALGNVNGVVIDPATGEALYEKNADSPITPASTGKILTAAAALLSLDPTEQLVTKVVEGDQPGEVIIVGGGDPTISSLEASKETIYPGAAHLSELVDQVKASGAQVQTVYIDQSRYAPPGLAPSWLPADIGAGYIAPIVPAMLDGDRQTDPTENYSPRTTDPGRTLVNAFAERIGASPAGAIEKKAPENAKVLGEIRSAPITQLVDNMLNRSENTLADVLAHEVAIKAGEEPNFDGASKAMLDVLRENGFDVDGVVLRDGSGMSEENKMTAKLLAEVLAVAAAPDGKDPRTAKLRPLLGGLPVAGGSGTLADRYTDADAVAGKGWVRAKTGSLTGINSLAGIVLDKDNKPLVFAFMTSGTVATSARPALDAVTAALRGCGCQ